MSKEAYWSAYFGLKESHNIPKSSPLKISKKINWDNSQKLYKLSGQNKQNAILLFASALQWISALNKADFYTDIQFGEVVIPVFAIDNTNDFKSYAKNNLSIFKKHIEYLPFNISYFNHKNFKEHKALFFVSELKTTQNNSIFQFTIPEKDENYIECLIPQNAELYTEKLLKTLSLLLDGISDNITYDMEPELIEEFKAFAENSESEIKPLVEEAWNSIFPIPLNPDNNFFENGADSIQAIRLLSKLKNKGIDSDLSSLLSARNLNSWIKNLAFTPKKTIAFADSPEAYPLSSMQELIWNHSLFHQNLHSYQEQFLFELDICPDLTILENAYHAIWNLYPQLNIQIGRDKNGNLVQKKTNRKADFRKLQNQKSIDAVLQNDKNEGFPAQLMRCLYFEIFDKKYLLWSHHHVLLDGWSVGKLIGKFIEKINSPSIENQNPDYQYYLVQQEQLQAQKEKQSRGNFYKVYEALHLPKIESNQTGFQSITFSLDISELKNFEKAAKDNKISLQNWFVGILGLTTYALNGKEKQYFHAISSGRSILGETAENAIGLFIRNISVGQTVQCNDTLSTFFKKSKEEFLEALRFEFTNENIDLSGDFEMPELLFVYENYPYEQIHSEQISGKLIYNFEQTAYPLTLLLMPTENGLKMQLIYDAAKFKDEYISGFARKFNDLCKIIAETDTERKIIELHNNSERQKEINNNLTECWTERIDTVLNSSKHYISDLKDKKISFYDCYESAGRFCQFTKEKGLKPGSRIALIAERNAELPLLIYSILRSGYSYLPIHTAWPEQRINEVLKIADCTVCISNAELKSVTDIPIVKPEEWQNLAPHNLPEIDIDSEAYLLFTSGTSGTPKGVSISHRNLSAFLADASHLIGNRNFDFLFSFTNIGFDLSIFENLYGFYIDKPVVVLKGIEDTETGLLKYPRGLLNTVPSVLSKLGEEEIKSLNIVHSAGEPLTKGIFQQLRDTNPSLIIRNWYGPTETTTYSTFKELEEIFDASVGRALPSETIDILDYLNFSVSDNLPGQVVIGGEGVARGYINEAKSGFKTLGDKKYYFTGDMGYKIENQLYLLGRNDRQMKRLGQRFEPAEVERAIFEITQGTKRVLYDKDEQNRFVLFIENIPVEQSLLLSKLHLRFPAYMIPDEIVFCEKFPENNNGKTDKTALWLLISDYKQKNVNEGEHPLLRRLKKEINSLQPLKGNIGFLQQGADSIIGLRLTGKLKNMGYQAELPGLFSASTINEWLNQLDYLKINKNSGKIFPSLTPIQEWFFEAYPGNKNHFNQSILLEILLPTSTETLASVAEEALNNFEILNLCFDGKWKKIADRGSTKTYITNSEKEITKICSQIQSSFDLKNGPVYGSAIFSCREKKYLFISIHHFYCDGFTWRLILDSIQKVLIGENFKVTENGIFSSLRAAMDEFDLQKAIQYWGNEIFNPFCDLQVSSYLDSKYVEWSWSNEETDWFLKKLPTDLNTQTNENLLLLFLNAWQNFEDKAVSIFFETHGRSYQSVQYLDEAAGWFTQFYPVFTRNFPNKNENLVEKIQEAFAGLPDGGLSYMALPDWKKPAYPVLLNFLGSFDEDRGAIAMPSDISQGEQADPGNPMLAFIELNAIVLDFKIKWMLRTHPSVDISLLKNQLNAAMQSIKNQINMLKNPLSQVDSDDLDIIENLIADI
jgi:acyl-coenzyme A synthetase/AMP-(fatty) acid ligase/aryl carrier-like protein